MDRTPPLPTPLDLVAWSRANARLSAVPESDQIRLRSLGNQACPKEGWWFTPAQTDSRRHFKAGEIMPGLDDAYGETIWEWDTKQD